MAELMRPLLAELARRRRAAQGGSGAPLHLCTSAELAEMKPLAEAYAAGQLTPDGAQRLQEILEKAAQRSPDEVQRLDAVDHERESARYWQLIREALQVQLEAGAPVDYDALHEQARREAGDGTA